MVPGRNGHRRVWWEFYTRHDREARRATNSALEPKKDRDYIRTRARARPANQASDWVDRGREVVNQQKDQFRAAYEAGRQAYQEATTETGAPKNL
jgi:hypothetical protein